MPPRRPADTGDDSDSLDRGVVPGSSKRRRIALACSTCRCRKSRCDGKRPKCSGCEALGFECSYVQSSSSSNVIVGKEYLTDLEARLERVESRLSATEQGRLLPSPSNSLPPSSQYQSHQHEQLEDSETVASVQRATPSSADITFQYEHRSDEAEGATDGIGSLSFADEEDSAFLGPSSNIAFMRHLGPALARISPTAARISDMNMPHASFATSRPLEGDMIRASRRASLSGHNNLQQRDGVSGGSLADKPRSHGNSAFSLPPEPEVQRLMDAYFSNTGLLFPFIHEGTFRQRYDEMKRRGMSSVQKTWLALLNMVLAFAISTSSDSSYLERQKESDVFYRRSIALCREQMLRASSLETVQLQLLTSQYLQGSHKSLQTWMVHGLAIKGAFQLGLHCQDLSAAFTPLEREYRKRVWYGCVLLDRTLSMTFGRPPSIPEEYIRIDIPAPEPPLANTSPYSAAAAADQHTKTISLSFFNATISLYAILNQTITRCYDSNLGCTTAAPIPVTETVNRVYALETQLQDWRASLPPELRYTPASTPTNDIRHDLHPPAIHTRATTVLTLRYHNLRILVHRPILTSILDTAGVPVATNRPRARQAASHQQPALLLLKQVGAYNLNCSLESALDIVAVVRAALLLPADAPQGRQSASPLGAWWFTLYYTFNAALVIAATLVIRLTERQTTTTTTMSMSGLMGSSAWSRTEGEAMAALEAAAEALAALDSGNRMVGKCRRHLGGLVAALGSVFAAKDEPHLESYSSLMSPPPPTAGPAGTAVAASGCTGAGARSMAAEQLGGAPPDAPDLGNPFNAGSSGGGPFGTSPMGVELGEFMTDMDAEILNLFFS